MADWMRGCDADYGNATVKGGPFEDSVTATITMHFGPRAPLEVSPGVWTGWIDPATGQRVDFHYGIDIAGVPEGTPLVALGHGTVSRVINGDPSFGNFVECTYEGGGHTYRVQYLHMQYHALVSVGWDVAPGDLIGRLGTTGASTGPHLHMAIYRDDHILDPMSELVAAQPVGFVPAAPPAAPVYPVPDVQWVPQGWGAQTSVEWEHAYPMRAKTVRPGAYIGLERDGRDGDWEKFHLVIQDY